MGGHGGAEVEAASASRFSTLQNLVKPFVGQFSREGNKEEERGARRAQCSAANGSGGPIEAAGSLDHCGSLDAQAPASWHCPMRSNKAEFWSASKSSRFVSLGLKESTVRLAARRRSHCASVFYSALRSAAL